MANGGPAGPGGQPEAVVGRRSRTNPQSNGPASPARHPNVTTTGLSRPRPASCRPSPSHTDLLCRTPPDNRSSVRQTAAPVWHEARFSRLGASVIYTPKPLSRLLRNDVPLVSAEMKSRAFQ